MVTVDLIDLVLGGIARPAHRQPRARSICRRAGNRVGHFWRRKRFGSSDENSAGSARSFTSWTGIVCTVAHDSGHERRTGKQQVDSDLVSRRMENCVLLVLFGEKTCFWECDSSQDSRERCKWRRSIVGRSTGGTWWLVIIAAFRHPRRRLPARRWGEKKLPPEFSGAPRLRRILEPRKIWGGGYGDGYDGDF